MFNVGDMVKKKANPSLVKGIGIVVRTIEHDDHTGNMRDLYYVEWIETNEQYSYEAKELTLVSRA